MTKFMISKAFEINRKSKKKEILHSTKNEVSFLADI